MVVNGGSTTIYQNDFGRDKTVLQDGGKEASPWIGADGSMLQNIKDQYANAIIVRFTVF